MPTWTSSLTGPEESRGEPSEETAFWASSTCAGPSSHGGRSSAGVPEPGSCVLVGPTGSGKTSFLVSLVRAFELERSPNWTRFVAGRQLTSLINSSLVFKTDRVPLTPRTPWATYSFQIGLRSAESNATGTAEEMEISVLDTSGSFFEALVGEDSGEIDQDQVLALVRAVRNARCLVLCVNAGSERADRQVGLVGLISRLLGVGPRRLQRVGAKPWPARESPWERGPRFELPFDRVLVLLTRIEALCAEAARRLAYAQTEWLAASPTEICNLASYQGLSAWGVAELLDLWPFAEERIDDLDVLASSLKPDAHLAICGVSAAGLERTLPNVQSTVSLAGSLSFGSGEPEPLIDSAPFGIWQSLLFMTTGRVIPPLMTIDPSRRWVTPPRWSRLHDVPGEGS